MVLGTGKRVHVAFCPERVAEGKAMEELPEQPQIVSGCDAQAVAMATELFRKIARSTHRAVAHRGGADQDLHELWRYIQFATANQFFMIAANYGLDFYKIHEAMTRDYPRMAGLPRSGFAAGPCLFKDTMQLAAAADNNFALGHSAMLINEGLPNFLVQQDQGPLAARPDADGHPGHGLQGGQRRPPRVALVQAPQGPRLRVGRLPLHRRPHQGPGVPAGRARSSTGRTCSSSGRRTPSTAPCELPAVDAGRRHLEPVRQGSLSFVKILVTGAAGFIAGYLVEELLNAGHEVVGLDNHSKYGPVEHAYDTHQRYRERRRRRQGRRPARRTCWPTATTSSPARRSSAGSPCSTSWPTT